MKAFDKGVVRSITHSFGRFLAIAVIAALGTGFYAGLRMTAPDMKLAGDEFYDATNLSDVRVLSTLGFTDSDVDELRGVEGVEGAMGAWEADAIASVDGDQYTMRIHSLDVAAARASDTSDGQRALSDDADYLNRPLLVEGSWPDAPGECVIGADVVMDGEVSVGDVIELIEGTQDLSETLTTTKLTITGFVNSSYYASPTSLGTTSLGNGSIEQYAYVADGTFDESQPYTEVFLTVAGAKDVAASSEAYDERVDAVVNRIEDASDALAASRLADVKADAQAELDERRADYERQRADAEAQLDDAAAQLDDAHAQLVDAADQLGAAQSQLDDAAAQLTDAASQLAASRDQLDAAPAQLDASRAQLDAAAAQIAQSREQLEGGQAAYDAAAAQLAGERAAAEERFDAAQAGIDAARAALDADDPAYEQTSAQLDAAQAQLDAQRAAAAAAFGDAQSQLDATAAELAQGRAAYEAGAAQAQAGEDAYAAGVAAYEQGRAAYESGQAEYAQGLADYEAGLAIYEQGSADYESGLASYQDGLAAYERQRAEADSRFADAAAQLDDAQAQIDDIEAPTIYVLDRSKNVGVASFESDADRVDQIAAVFPFLFFLVAALVSLTTMTRMVEEERVLIGTYKALGYGRGRITSKYLLYAIVASGVGSLVGIVALSQFLPYFIMEAYAIVYAVPQRPTPIDAPIALISAGLGIGITVAATWFAAASTLRESPAALMLPRAPKAGKRILLERIGPLWRRLSFSWKVTARNIFRYKRRFFMAIIGIAGCTALLLTGLGLRDAINDIIDKQFGEIYQYSMTVRTDDEVPAADEEAIDAVLDDASHVTGHTLADTENMIAVADGMPDQRLELIVPQDPATFETYVTMRERIGHAPLSLGDDGVIVSEKLAKRLGLSVGDEMSLHEEDAIGNASGRARQVRIAGIMENYVSQYVFMTPDLYREVMGEDPVYSTIYAKTTDDAAARDQMSEELRALGSVKTVSYNDEAIDTYRTMLSSVDAVIVVLVVAAAALAFVVLYNLTNINITERAREIATLKVLGFTPHEVSAYIYRETILLTALGAALGLVLGVFMEAFVVTTAEVDQVMFGREVHLASFAIAFALTMLFSCIVTLAMKRKLDRIDMVESLKSVE